MTTPAGQLHEVLDAVLSELEQAQANDVDSAAGYAADVVTRLVRTYGLQGVAASLAADGVTGSTGWTFTVAMEVTVRVDELDEFATSEYGLQLEDELDYSLDDVKTAVADQLAGFLANEVNNCNEMLMTVHSASAAVTGVTE